MSVHYNDHTRFQKLSKDLLAGLEVSLEEQTYGLRYIQDQYWYNPCNREFQVIMQILDDLHDLRIKTILAKKDTH